ncbi:MAG TPA: cation:proton antiporter [Actinomycetota bacterium]|nr:cation:proton antiporter [Actinomycetota bacterium]
MHGPLFLLELGGVVLLLAVLSRIAGRFGFSPIPLYLVAGLAFGEGGVIPLVTAEEFVEAGATIGLVLLLFSLGLEYSAQDLMRSLREGAGVGGADIVLNAVPGFLAGLLLGWGLLAATVLAGVTYISSSGVVARLLDDLGWMGNRETSTVLGVLVFEDLAMAMFLPIVSILLTGGQASEIALEAALAGVLVAGILVLASRYGDVLSRAIAARSDEAFLLAVLGILLVVAGSAEAVNVSAAVGAFLTGIVVSGSAASRARNLIRPLRDVFAGAFFLFFGFQVDPASIPSVAIPAVLLAAVGAATKLATGWWGARRAGVGERGRRRAGWVLVARGEFSIVIAGLAVAAGLEPKLGPLAATYVLLLAVVGPLATHLLHRAASGATRG